MKVIVPDTNIFLRFLVKDNLKQTIKARELFKKAAAKQLKIIVYETVVFEMAYILLKYYRLDKKEVIEKLKQIVSADFFEVEKRNLILQALKQFQNNNNSFIDNYLLVRTINESFELYTFDKKLSSQFVHLCKNSN